MIRATRNPGSHRWHHCLVALTAVMLFGGVPEGCAPSLSLTVPPDLIQRLPKTTRRGVFQAETVVTIAIDRKSTIKREIDTNEREIDRTKEKIAEVEKLRANAGAREVEKADLEIVMLEAKVDYLGALLDHLHVRLKLAEKELLLAGSQFELEKAKLVKKHSIAFDASLEDFEEQVKSIQADVDDFRKEVESDQAELKKAEETWLAAKKTYYSAIGESSKGWWTE